MAPARTLLLGLGNTIMSDDAAGILVARRLRESTPSHVDVEETERAGLRLLDLLTGYEEAILVDAIVTGEAPAGSVRRLSPEQLPPSLTLASSHEVDLVTALQLGRELDISLPAQVAIWTIEAEDPWTLGEGVSPAVADGVARCAKEIRAAHFDSSEQRVDLGEDLAVGKVTPLDR